MTVSKVLERKDVPQESKWNDKAVFASWDEWKREVAALKSALPQLSTFDGKLAQGPAELADWLALVTALDRRLMRLWSYVYMANAVDAIKDKGTIWIATNHTDGFLEISIKDDGHGIPKEIQNKIFDPFFTTKSVGEGTGLGLAITFGIIGEHNGTIEVNSKEGEGTEFIIQLPIQ